MKAAEAAGSTVILAVDPDADRLQVMERDTASGSWRVFSGNEIGTLLSWWAFKNYKEMKGTSFDGVLEWILLKGSAFIKCLTMCHQHGCTQLPQ